MIYVCVPAVLQHTRSFQPVDGRAVLLVYTVIGRPRESLLAALLPTGTSQPLPKYTTSAATPFTVVYYHGIHS